MHMVYHLISIPCSAKLVKIPEFKDRVSQDYLQCKMTITHGGIFGLLTFLSASATNPCFLSGMCYKYSKEAMETLSCY